jgi:adenylosuccinate synthase
MIVVGLGFGDEGKGLVTSFLASKVQNPIVIRFNGGHQAGHTVFHNNHRHVFSSFNSATLQGAPTYWSKYCTFHPDSFLNEYNALKDRVDEIQYYVHALSPVTTPFDIISNQVEESSKGSKSHGSVGVGFGKTLKRQDDFYKLFVQDFLNEKILRIKLSNIAKYYNPILNERPNNVVIEETINSFIAVIKEVIVIVKDDIEEFDILDSMYDSVIFEGAQGIMLDQDFGIFPNVTRSNTTCKNALEILDNNIIANNDKLEIYYVTRTYQTRHGNGFMTNEDLPFYDLKNAENETNKSHKYQGDFRKSILDVDLLNYALRCDNHFSCQYSKNLVITCVDQTGERIKITENNELKEIDVKDLHNKLNVVRFSKVFLSYGDNISKIKQIV